MTISLHPVSEWPHLPLDIIESSVTQEGDKVAGLFKGLKLTSAFQPIFSIAHRRPVGYEGLLRAFSSNGTPVSPIEVFRNVPHESDAIFLDRLCRNLHLRNFLATTDDTSWIFFNISPQVVVNGKRYGAYFADLLERYNIPPHRIVIEILEGAIHDESLLAEAVGYYKELGCLVAIDDFGAGHSNFDRIWRIAPDIVKLDRSVIAQAASNRTVARVLPNLANLIHESGSLALMEGIESEKEALIAMDSGIDFVQGYYFGKPSENLLPVDASENRIAQLCGKFKEFSDNQKARTERELAQHMHTFSQAACLLRSGAPLEKACERFLSQPKVERCYILDQNGMQLGQNLVAPSRGSRNDPRFLPVSNADGANWSRRHYFQRAVNHPGQIQTTRPYLSVTGANMCITLSIAIEDSNELRVLCCDLNSADA